MLIYSSPQLFAVSHVLLRLLMPRHSPCALGRLHFYMLFSLYELSEFHFTNIWLLKILCEKASYFRTLLCLNLFFPPCFSFRCCFGEIVVITHYGKTLNSIDLVNLMSSVSVRFNSFLFLYSIFNEHMIGQKANPQESLSVGSTSPQAAGILVFPTQQG